MKLKSKILLTLFLLLIPAMILVSCGKKGTGKGAVQSSQKAVKKYTCPMHPSYVAEKPGECPVCGMNLVPVEEEPQVSSPAQTPAPAAKKKKTMYRSTMNPDEVSDKPGKDSMGMEMEAFEVEESQNVGTPQVEGLSSIKVSPEKQQLIGVKTAIAVRKDVARTIRTNGRVAYDPDLYYAEQEYITSVKSYEQSRKASQGMFSDSAKSLLDASRFKLKLMGLGDEQISNLREQGVPDSSLLLTKGNKNVWVYASVFEDDTRYVKAGQTVSLSAPSIISDEFSGKIIAIDPVLDPGTRSAKARILAENPSDLLKPETYLNVEINVPLGSQIVIPSDAVMDTGTRQVVFVINGEGVLEPKEVKVSNQTDDSYVIKSGISEGDKVVTNANFLIDSESQLKASMQKAADGGGHKH
jgi:hypothetical protein